MQETGISPKDVVVEGALLKLLSNRDNYDKYNAYINYKRLLPPTKVMLLDYKKYYELYKEHKEIDFSIFYTHFSQTWHKDDLADLDIQYYKNDVLGTISKVTKEEEDSCFVDFKKIDLAENIRKNVDNPEKVRELIDKFHTTISTLVGNGSDTELFTINDVDVSLVDKSNGIPWFLSRLQKSLGSIISEQFILVCADNNVGKGAFCVSQVCFTLEYFRKQKINKPIMYFNSESSATTVFIRIMCCLFRKTKQELLANIEQYKLDFVEKYGEDCLYIFQIKNNNLQWIKHKIEQYGAGLVIIDLLDALAPDLAWESLTKLYNQVRIIADEHYPIIATSQSGNTEYTDKDTGERKTRKFLTAKDTFGSKSGKGGAAETMIMIGKDDNHKHIRYLSLTKDKEGVGNLRLTCEFDEKYSLYKDLAF